MSTADVDIHVVVIATLINCKVLLKSQHRNRTIFVDVSSIQGSLRNKMYDILPAERATGCDSISTFAGKKTCKP